MSNEDQIALIVMGTSISLVISILMIKTTYKKIKEKRVRERRGQFKLIKGEKIG